MVVVKSFFYVPLIIPLSIPPHLGKGLGCLCNGDSMGQRIEQDLFGFRLIHPLSIALFELRIDPA